MPHAPVLSTVGTERVRHLGRQKEACCRRQPPDVRRPAELNCGGQSFASRKQKPAEEAEAADERSRRRTRRGTGGPERQRGGPSIISG
ncbi:hypothetical protein PUN28_013469 [Cardiocondyla obscurior]|uniref:Uncharacterized protein n=1 Tax=Cardiocondyla obscurior TaxID=286306 RepID=A0AAW2F6P1_9HYME